MAQYQTTSCGCYSQVDSFVLDARHSICRDVSVTADAVCMAFELCATLFWNSVGTRRGLRCAALFRTPVRDAMRVFLPGRDRPPPPLCKCPNLGNCQVTGPHPEWFHYGGLLC